jgi:hypothetical protein
VFDENDFPFSQLHSNAGAQLRVEILLLPPTLRNYHGDHLVDGHLAHGANPVTNQIIENHDVQAEEISEEQAHPMPNAGSSMEPAATADPDESSLDHVPSSRSRSASESGSISVAHVGTSTLDMR